MSPAVESSWVGSVARRFGSLDVGDAYFPRNYELPDLVKNVEALIRVDLRPNVRRCPLRLSSVFLRLITLQAWALKCEKGALRRILINLLSNSFKVCLFRIDNFSGD